jgi:hypothetical protein
VFHLTVHQPPPQSEPKRHRLISIAKKQCIQSYKDWRVTNF